MSFGDALAALRAARENHAQTRGTPTDETDRTSASSIGTRNTPTDKTDATGSVSFVSDPPAHFRGADGNETRRRASDAMWARVGAAVTSVTSAELRGREDSWRSVQPECDRLEAAVATWEALGTLSAWRDVVSAEQAYLCAWRDLAR